MFRTDFIRNIGGFDIVPSCQEYILMQKALDAKPRFGYLPVTLIKNFQHEGDQLSTGPKKLAGQKMLIENKKKYFEWKLAEIDSVDNSIDEMVFDLYGLTKEEREIVRGK